MGNFIDIIGRKYGLLTVQSFSHKKGYKQYYNCVCECGGKKTALKGHITQGMTRSCGCAFLKAITKHGLYGHPIYKIYRGIKCRCYYKKDKIYCLYGGKGVVMCEEWKNDFMSFYNWCMANGWRMGLELDKDIIPYNRGEIGLIYSPENCQFVTSQVNSSYKSNSNRILKNGIEKTASDWAKFIGVSKSTIARRVKNNAPDNEFFSSVKLTTLRSKKYKKQHE